MMSGSQMTIAGLPAVTGANVVYIGSGIVTRNTSGLKHKVDVHLLCDAGPFAGGSILDIEPIRYRERYPVERHAEGDPKWLKEPRWWVGWAAEDFIAAGWEEMVSRDEETGEPENLHYDRVLAALSLELRNRFDEISVRFDALEGAL
jgi:hypothetical protein